MYFSSALVLCLVELVLAFLIPAPTSVAAIELGAVIEQKFSYGNSFAMSADGTTIAVWNRYGFPAIAIRVYEKKLLRRTYEPIGPDITLPSLDLDEWSLVLSADGTTIAVGLTSRSRGRLEENLNIEARLGQVRIYQKDSSSQTYKEVGSDIIGEGARCCGFSSYCGNYSDCIDDIQNNFYTSMSISADGTTIAVRAPFSTDSDIVRVYQKDSSSSMYEQIGSDINVTSAYYFGGSLAMSADGTIIIVSFIGLQVVRVYLKDSTNQMYQRIGSDIEVDEGSFPFYSDGCSMSADGTTIALKGPFGILVYQKESFDETYKQIGESFADDAFGYGQQEYSVSADGTRIAVSYTLENFDPNSNFQFLKNAAQARVFQKDSTTKTYRQIEFLGIPGDFGTLAWTSITGDGKMIAVGGFNREKDRFQVFTSKQCVFGFDNFFCPFSFRAVWVGLLRRLLN